MSAFLKLIILAVCVLGVIGNIWYGFTGLCWFTAAYLLVFLVYTKISIIDTPKSYHKASFTIAVLFASIIVVGLTPVLLLSLFFTPVEVASIFVNHSHLGIVSDETKNVSLQLLGQPNDLSLYTAKIVSSDAYTVMTANILRIASYCWIPVFAALTTQDRAVEFIQSPNLRQRTAQLLMRNTAIIVIGIVALVILDMAGTNFVKVESMEFPFVYGLSIMPVVWLVIITSISRIFRRIVRWN